MGLLGQYLRKHAQDGNAELEQQRLMLSAGKGIQAGVKSGASPQVAIADALPGVWNALTEEQRQNVVGGTVAGSKVAPVGIARSLAGKPWSAAGRAGLWALPAIEAGEMALDYKGKGERAYKLGRHDPGLRVEPATTWGGKLVATGKHLMPIAERVLNPVNTLASHYDQALNTFAMPAANYMLKRVGSKKRFNPEPGLPQITGTYNSLRNALLQALSPVSGPGAVNPGSDKELKMIETMLQLKEAYNTMRQEKDPRKKAFLAAELEKSVKGAVGLKRTAGGLSVANLVALAKKSKVQSPISVKVPPKVVDKTVEGAGRLLDEKAKAELKDIYGTGFIKAKRGGGIEADINKLVAPAKASIQSLISRNVAKEQARNESAKP